MWRRKMYRLMSREEAQLGLSYGEIGSFDVG